MVVRALIHEPIRDLRRAGEIVRLVAAHGFGYLLHRERIPEIEVPEDSPAALGKPTEERLRELLEALGPTFIKLGQILSTRPDVLPPAMAHALKALQDGALPVPLEDIHAQIRAELGRPAQDLFLEFDPDPIASASIAQVHRARLDTETGPRDVVIKVQRPGIHDQMLADLSLLRWLAWVLEGTIEEVSAYSPSAVVEQFELALKEELDFQHEMSNLLRARANFAERPDLLVVPEPFPDVSSGRVIVMACLDGCKVTAAKEADPHGLASRVVDVTFKQIFEDGFFHGDPHPGNILVLSDGRIGMIDYGVWGRLTRPQQDVLVELLMAIVFKSPPILARLAFRVGKPPASFDREAFEGEVGSLMDRYVGVELNQVSAGSLIGDAVDVIRRHRIQIPPEFALLLRATATLEGVLREVYPSFDLQALALPYMHRLIGHRFNLERLGPEAVALLLGLRAFVTEVPSQIDQLLRDLSAGRFQVNLGGESLREAVIAQQTLGVRQVLAILAGAGLLSASVLTLHPNLPVAWGVPILSLVALAISIFATGGLVLTFLFPSGLRRIRLRTFLPRSRT